MSRPFVFIFSTASVDGRIAGEDGFSRLSCEEDFDLQHVLRASSDAVMVGSRTALLDNPRLTVRRVKGRSPIRVVVDSKLRVTPNMRLFSTPSSSIIVTSSSAPRDRIEEFKKLGVNVLIAGEDRVDLAEALKLLHELYGIKRLMVEGGGSLNCALLTRGLVDEVRVTIAPYVLGGGVSLFQGSCRAKLALLDMKRLCGGWIHLVYRVVSDFRA